jgi:hypothetical protein
MQVVINTQYRENYGEPGSPHWKFKGGDVYVIPNTAVLTREEREELRNLIEYSNEMSEMYISSTHVLGDDEVVCDEWEAPIVLDRSLREGTWTAFVVHKNDGQFIDGIEYKTETWTLLPEGKRQDYTAIYTVTGGQVLNEDGLIEMLKLKKG